MGKQDILLILGKSQDAPGKCDYLTFLNRYLSETQRFNFQDYSPYLIKSTRLKLVIIEALFKVAW
jgi:hypothetical protein